MEVAFGGFLKCRNWKLRKGLFEAQHGTFAAVLLVACETVRLVLGISMVTCGLMSRETHLLADSTVFVQEPLRMSALPSISTSLSSSFNLRQTNLGNAAHRNALTQ